MVLLHVVSLVQYGCLNLHPQFSLFAPRYKVWSDAMTWRSLRTRERDFIYSTMNRLMSSEKFLVVFNSVELTGQSYEALDLAGKLVDRQIVAVYFVLGRSKTNVVFLHWTSSLISFGLSCLVHFFGLILPLLHYKFVDPSLESSPTWLTHYVLYARHNFVTSPTDLIAKVVVQLGSLISLWRLVDNVRTATPTTPKIRQQLVGPLRDSTAAGTPHVSKLRGIYIVASIAWGCFLAGSLVHSMWFRTMCPSSCVEFVAPLWTTDCQCMFVHVNCHLLGHQDVEMELHAQPLGVHVFAIVVSRCDLRHGILNSTLHQFDQLYFIGIYFTNTTSWDGTFPATVNTVTMSYGTLETIPSILERDIPASMVALRLSSHPFQAFEIPPAWHLVRDLRLVNLSHVVFDPTTLATFDFIMLVLAFANLTTLPPGIDAMSHLATVDVSGNLFDKAPRTLLSRQVQVIACGNPINLTEPLDPPQRLNFDWTQSTSC
ncbi:hypothetical protein LEN26_004360 [Aphanomyces euteiches]|nr:hypothetical protein AeMF1_001803 [Aphanomyces euteiches]KAH9149031.1 hypothetical protein LEN26_004360 [Aphanomyces euteiches]KAH9191278.1 hypothetical protein AeNC1_006746 [Aphanomyces euteiches]